MLVSFSNGSVFFSISVEALLSMHFSSLYLNAGNYKTFNYQWLLPNQKKINELLLLITCNNLIFFCNYFI